MQRLRRLGTFDRHTAELCSGSDFKYAGYEEVCYMAIDPKSLTTAMSFEILQLLGPLTRYVH